MGPLLLGKSFREILRYATLIVLQKRLCDEVLELGPEGVVRVSMVHYNTEDEIRGLVETLKNILS